MSSKRHPYAGRPAATFWSSGVAAVDPSAVDPVFASHIQIAPNDRVVSLGSCFAQHLSGHLGSRGFRAHTTEPRPASVAALDEGYGVYPARTGNIYTVRQLLQLFDRAYGLFQPVREAWQLESGRLVDPFRPRVQPSGFQSKEDLYTDQAVHLSAVRRMFEEADVFIFTLGLTEAWERETDGSIVPLAPGVVGTAPDPSIYRFVNFSLGSMLVDMEDFIAKLRFLNPQVRIILTVSPVPLAATFEERHVLVSTVSSKAKLRCLCDEMALRQATLEYFPSFEIVTGPQSRGRYFEADLRGVTREGVAHVMGVFEKHYLASASASRTAEPPSPPPAPMISAEARHRLDELSAVVCDESEIGQ